ncbi:trichohyalin-like [Megalops cyprinoides]|uniref:trichohyalin-like n=1 Tax=Megalops cyprinoides TaxID=118141 RepID=UPI001863BBBD|nr:trichohyalin-like [Megalops cyprinoides]
MSGKKSRKAQRMGSTRRGPRGNSNQRTERDTEGMERMQEEERETEGMGQEGSGGAETVSPHEVDDKQSKNLLPSLQPLPLRDTSSSVLFNQSPSPAEVCLKVTTPSVMTDSTTPTHYNMPADSSLDDVLRLQASAPQKEQECTAPFAHQHQSENAACSPSTSESQTVKCVDKSATEHSSIAKDEMDTNGQPQELSKYFSHVDEAQLDGSANTLSSQGSVQDVSLLGSTKTRRKMGSTRKAFGRASEQSDIGEGWHVMEQAEKREERTDGQKGELGGMEKEKKKAIDGGGGGEMKVQGRKEEGAGSRVEEHVIIAQRHQAEGKLLTEKSPDLSLNPNETQVMSQEFAPTPHLYQSEHFGHPGESEHDESYSRNRKRKVGSTRKNRFTAKNQRGRGGGELGEEGEGENEMNEGDRGELEVKQTCKEVVEVREKEDVSVLKKPIPETQDENNLNLEFNIISNHQNTESTTRNPHAQGTESKKEDRGEEDIEERGTEGQMRDEEMKEEVMRLEEEQGKKEEDEREEEMDIEIASTSVSSTYESEISDQSQQVENTSFAKEMGTAKDLSLKTTETIVYNNEADGKKLSNLAEESVIGDDQQETEVHILPGSPDLAFNLNDNQGRSQGFESPFPQLDQSEQIKEEEHDDSRLPTRQRKMGSSRRSRSAAKDQRGRGWEELGEEREGEKGDQEGMERETEKNEGSGGEPEVRQTYEEVVGTREEEEEEEGVLKKQSSQDENNLHIESIIIPKDQNMDSTMKNPQTQDGDKEMEERGERDIKEEGTEAEMSKEVKGSAIEEMREGVLEKERGNKEGKEREDKLEIESAPISVTSIYEPEISDQPQEIEHSTSDGETETVQDTQVILGRTENIGHESEVDAIKHHRMIEDSVTASDQHQSEEHMLLGKSPDLAFSLNDSQGGSQETESPIPQLDQSEHYGQVEEEEHEDSQLPMRKRKMGSSRRSRSAAKNQRGRGWEELGKEREGEKGDQEGMEKETENEMNEGSGGGKEAREIDNEVEEDREKEEETNSEVKEYETKVRKAERERDEMQEQERIKEHVITAEMAESIAEGKGVEWNKDEHAGEIMEEESGLEGNPDLAPFRGETEKEDSYLQTLSLTHSEGKIEGVTSLGEENNLPSETLQQQSCPQLEDTLTVHPKELTNDTQMLECTEAQITDQSKDSDNNLFSGQSDQLVTSEELLAEPLNTQSAIQMSETQTSQGEHNLHIESVIISNDQNMDSTMKTLYTQDREIKIEDKGEGDTEERGTEGEKREDAKGSDIEEMNKEVSVMEQERGSKEEEEMEAEMEIVMAPTSVSCIYESETSGQPQQFEDSSVAEKMEVIEDTLVPHERIDNIVHVDEADGNKLHRMIEDTVTASDRHQSEEHMLLGKSPDLAFSLNDSQGGSQETESPVPQLDQSEHYGQVEEAEHEDSQLAMRKRKMGSSRRSRSAAKNQRGRGWEELGEEREGEKGEVEGMEKEHEMNEGREGEPEVKQIYEEVVEAREEEEGEEGVLKKQSSQDENNLHIESIIIPKDQNMDSTMKSPQTQDGDKEMAERQERDIKEEGTEAELSKEVKGSATEEMREGVLVLEKEQGNKEEEEREEKLEIELAPTSVSSIHQSEISDQPRESEGSIFAGETETEQDTQVTLGRTETIILKSEADSIKHQSLIEDSVTASDQHQTEDHMLLVKSSDLAFNHNDNQGRSQELECPIPQLGQSEHSEQMKEEEHDDSQLAMRKRKMGSSRRSRSAAKNQRGRGWEELGEEREGEKGEQEGIEKEHGMNEERGGEPEVRQTYEEVVGAREEVEEGVLKKQSSPEESIIIPKDQNMDSAMKSPQTQDGDKEMEERGKRHIKEGGTEAGLSKEEEGSAIEEMKEEVLVLEKEEDTVISSDHHQSEEHMLLGKSPDLTFSLNDSQGRSQETESPVPQLDQSEHYGQVEEEEHEDSQLAMRKRKMGSSRRSRSAAKNQRGRGWEELGEEREGEKGEVEGMEKEHEMNEGREGEPEVKQIYEEVVEAREEEEGEEGVLKKQSSQDENNLHIESIIIPKDQNMDSTMKSPQTQDGDKEMEEKWERDIKEEGTEAEMSKEEKGSEIEEMREGVLVLEKQRGNKEGEEWEDKLEIESAPISVTSIFEPEISDQPQEIEHSTFDGEMETVQDTQNIMDKLRRRNMRTHS